MLDSQVRLEREVKKVCLAKMEPLEKKELRVNQASLVCLVKMGLLERQAPQASRENLELEQVNHDDLLFLPLPLPLPLPLGSYLKWLF